MTNPRAIGPEGAAELIMATLPEIARHHPGILERIELRLSGRIDDLDNSAEAQPAIDARTWLRRLIV